MTQMGALNHNRALQTQLQSPASVFGRLPCKHGKWHFFQSLARQTNSVSPFHFPDLRCLSAGKAQGQRRRVVKIRAEKVWGTSYQASTRIYRMYVLKPACCIPTGKSVRHFVDKDLSHIQDEEFRFNSRRGIVKRYPFTSLCSASYWGRFSCDCLLVVKKLKIFMRIFIYLIYIASHNDYTAVQSQQPQQHGLCLLRQPRLMMAKALHLHGCRIHVSWWVYTSWYDTFSWSSFDVWLSSSQPLCPVVLSAQILQFPHDLAF